MNYQQTINWLFSQLPMYQKLGKVAFNGKLDKILKFSEHLDFPEKKFKSIHVAGTNGKGSSSHMLSSILQEAGYKVGLYTSPHLKDFRERIRVNGKPVSKKFVTDFVKNNFAYFQHTKMSFFEMSVGMAFDCFAKEKVDIAIIEVGLGGRLDSTNIITPEVSLITNIGIDHTAILGDTLTKIAYEKAGIIKRNIPVVVSEYQEEIADVFHNAAELMNTKLLFASSVSFPTYSLDLVGNYQHRNYKGVLLTLKLLQGFKIMDSHILAGLKKVIENTGLLGRWQILSEHPLVVCDTAHNKEGLLEVIHQIAQQKFDTLHIVLGFVKDKDLTHLLPLFLKNATYYFCSPNNQRGLDALVLKKEAATFGLIGDAYSSINSAFTAAKLNANEKDFIFIGGSNFVVAEVV